MTWVNNMKNEKFLLTYEKIKDAYLLIIIVTYHYDEKMNKNYNKIGIAPMLDIIMVFMVFPLNSDLSVKNYAPKEKYKAKINLQYSLW